MNAAPPGPFRPWGFLSLRQTLMLGAGIGILLPALVLAFLQTAEKFDHEVLLRVRAPMQQYADVLSRGVAAHIWNLDPTPAGHLVDAVMRNPDAVSVTVTDANGEVFVRRQNPNLARVALLREDREIVHDGLRVGRVVVELTSERIRNELRVDLVKISAALAAQVAISFLFIWLLFDRRLMRPLRQLQDGVSRLARGQLDQPLSWRRADEIGSLIQGLDAMRIGLAELIAERDDKHKALSLSQAKVAAIFDASPVAISVSRMGGSFTFLDVNGTWVQLFGRDRDSSLGSSGDASEIWGNQEDRQTVLETLARDGEINRYAAWMRRGDGAAAILCEISGRVISVADESLVILAYDDITAQHNNEADILRLNATLEQRVADRTRELSDALSQLTAAQSELIRAEKLSALGAVVAGVAHELNTPVGNSLTVASTLQDHTRSFAADMDRPLTRSRLQAFVDSTRQGADLLVRSLLQAAGLVASFKQVAVDQTSLSRRFFNLRDTVADIHMTLGPSLRKTATEVVMDIPANVVMEGYPGAFGQVLTNLINNAVLHGFDGRPHGRITIAANLQDEDWVRIAVRDDGAGIPPDNLSRIFDPFFTTKLGKGGSGLGLHIVYNLVHDVLGGNIVVESTLGQGTCFIVTLPRRAPVSETQEPGDAGETARP